MENWIWSDWFKQMGKHEGLTGLLLRTPSCKNTGVFVFRVSDRCLSACFWARLVVCWVTQYFWPFSDRRLEKHLSDAPIEKHVWFWGSFYSRVIIKYKLPGDSCHNNEIVAKLLSSWSCWTFESLLIGASADAIWHRGRTTPFCLLKQMPGCSQCFHRKESHSELSASALICCCSPHPPAIVLKYDRWGGLLL